MKNQSDPVSLEGIQAVIFDLDGTLMDSMWLWEAIDIEFLGRFGISLPQDLQKEIEGLSFSETAAYFKKRFEIPMTLDQIMECWNEMAIDKYENQVPFKPYAREFLLLLKDRGIKTGIATSNSRKLVDAVLASHNASELFDTVVVGCQVARGKPSPDIYLYAAEILKVSPDKCLVFEDVPAGILAGKRAGMRVIAVEDDFSKFMKEEKKEMADGYIESYLPLIEAYA